MWFPVSPWKLMGAQKLSVGSAAVGSTPVGSQTRAVLISATTDCHVRIGQNAVAVAADTLIRSGWPPLIFGCAPGDIVSVIQDAAAGNLYVTELTH